MIKLSELLRIFVIELERAPVSFALAGGLVTSLYRERERLTQDIDFLLGADTADSETVAKSLVKAHQLTVRMARQSDLEGGPMFGRKRSPVMIVSGQWKDTTSGSHLGVDFLLPHFPWFSDALARAQHNQVDFGFGKIPCMTVEDVVLAKLHALKNDVTRFKDLDDLKSVFAHDQPIDLPYLSAKMVVHGFPIPDSLVQLVPQALRKTSKRITKLRRP